MKKTFSPCLGCLVLLCLVSPAMPSECQTPCQPGFVLRRGCKCVKCEAEQYWYLRSGVGTCDRCTASCFGQNNMVELSPCTATSNRRCHCKAGFYCPSPVDVTCRTHCLPCVNGFTKTSSLALSCQAYTDCAKLGMVVIKEGSATEDRVCGNPQTTTSPNPVATMLSVLPSITQMLRSTGHITSRSVPLNGLSSTQNDSSRHEMVVVTTAGAETSSLRNEGPVPLFEPPSKTTWIVLLLLLVLLLLISSCLSVKCKGKTFKKKLLFQGPVFVKNKQAGNAGPDVDTLLSASDAMDGPRGQGEGQGSFSRGNQQVTMDLSGKGESINNTVGSIFIYSPGMVILGSNSNERKEAEGSSEPCSEDNSEEHPLMSVPQQESSSQEDFGKDLSFPVPATSK